MGNTFTKLLKIEALEIENSFKKASIEGVGTSQEVADRREGVVGNFFAKYFPFPYRIVKGNIVDSYGRRSNSIDCIILNPSHPHTIDSMNSKASIIFADGVDFAIEVKPDLANKKELERGLGQIQSVKRLVKKRDGLIFHRKYNDEQIEYAKRIPSIIFADKTYKDVRTLISNIVDYYVKNNVPKIEQFDLIIINNSMVVYNSRKNSRVSFGDFEGIAFCESKENTMATLLFWMSQTPKSEPEISKNIIEIYLENISKEELMGFDDLNAKLLNINDIGESNE